MQERRGGTGSGDCRFDCKKGSGGSRFLPGKACQSNVHRVKEGRKKEAGPAVHESMSARRISSWRISEASKTSYIKATSWRSWTSKKPISVSIAYQSRRFLQFHCKDKLLQFTCFPFGLSSAPFVFAKLLHPVLASVRELHGSLLPHAHSAC